MMIFLSYNQNSTSQFTRKEPIIADLKTASILASIITNTDTNMLSKTSMITNVPTIKSIFTKWMNVVIKKQNNAKEVNLATFINFKLLLQINTTNVHHWRKHAVTLYSIMTLTVVVMMSIVTVFQMVIAM